MKKNFLLLIIALLFFTTIPTYSIDIQNLLSQIGFNIFAEKDPKTEITKILEKKQNYANKQNYKKLQQLYSTDYANFDGIKLDEYSIKGIVVNLFQAIDLARLLGIEIID